MSCIAIWYDNSHQVNNRSAEPLELELHLNFWKLRSTESNKNHLFLDVGILFENNVKAGHLNIFIPFHVDKDNDLGDLGQCFKNDIALVSTIFNEDYFVQATGQDKYLQVLNRDLVLLFSIYLIDLQNDVNVFDKYDGSIMSITIPENAPKGKLYLRFRINSKNLSMFSKVYRPANALLESAFVNTEVIDIKVNEKRNLSKSLLERISDDGQVYFTKIQLFIMHEADYDYVLSNAALTGSRHLETDTWTTYIGRGYKLDKVWAYQWKLLDKESFSAIVKYKFKKSNWKTIGFFILILIVTSIVAGIIADLISRLY